MTLHAGEIAVEGGGGSARGLPCTPIARPRNMMPPSLTAMAAAVAFAALVLARCDREYVYQPTVATTSATSGRPSASSGEPLRGDVQLTTVGFEEIQPGGVEES